MDTSICTRTRELINRLVPNKEEPIRLIMEEIVHDVIPTYIGHVDERCPDDILKCSVDLLFKAACVIYLRRDFINRGIDLESSSILETTNIMHEISADLLSKKLEEHYGAEGKRCSIDIVRGIIWHDRYAIDVKKEIPYEVRGN